LQHAENVEDSDAACAGKSECFSLGVKLQVEDVVEMSDKRK